MNPTRKQRSWWSKPSVLTSGGLLLILLIYALYQTRDVFRGPVITLATPAVTGDLLNVAGKTRRVAHLELNGGTIFANSDGDFHEKLLLAPGYNIIKLAARDRFGRETVRFLELAH